MPAGRARWPGGESQPTDPALVSVLQAAGTKWSAATVGTMQAAPLALDSGTDVMAIGGFSGGDPAPSLHSSSPTSPPGRCTTSSRAAGSAAARRRGERSRGGERGGSTISAWVEQHYTATTVGGRTVYDLTKPKVPGVARCGTSAHPIG